MAAPRSGTGGDGGGADGSGSGGSFGGAFSRQSDGHQPQGIAELANAAREQMQQFFGRASASGAEASAPRQPQASRTAVQGEASARSPSPAGGISPAHSLSEALQLEEENSLTFTRPTASPSPRHAASAPPAAGTLKAAPDPGPLLAATGAPAAFGSPTDGGGGVARAGKAPNDIVDDSPDAAAADDSAPDLERSGPSAAVEGLRQLLNDQERLSQALVARREAVRKRTSAGLAAVDSLGPGTVLALLAVAVAALAWAHGLAAMQLAAWLIGQHSAEVVAGVCLFVVALKGALAAHLDTRLRNFLDGMDDMHASVKQVAVMQEDVHTMRVIIERMQADLDAKTAWIPTGIKPPTWLPGQKGAAR